MVGRDRGQPPRLDYVLHTSAVTRPPEYTQTRPQSQNTADFRGLQVRPFGVPGPSDAGPTLGLVFWNGVP